MSKKQRLALTKKQERQKGQLLEEDNKVAELVLKGINLLVLKGSIKNDPAFRAALEKQTDLLFKMSHHSVFRIQLQTLQLLFQIAKACHALGSAAAQLMSTADAEQPLTFNDRFYRALYEAILRL